MHPFSCARTGRRRRDGFGSDGSRETGRPERRRPDDAEHGLVYDVVAGRKRVADGNALDAWCIISAVDARRIVDAVGAGRIVGARSAWRAVDTGSSFDAFSAGCTVDTGRSVGAVSAWCAVDTGRSVGALSAGRRFLLMR